MNPPAAPLEECGPTAVDLKPPGRLLLWRLAAAGGGEWIGEIRPAPSATVRKELLESGLAISETRRNQETGRSGTWIELTQAGWAWATGHLGDDLGAGSAAGDTLGVMLRGLGQFLAAQRLTAEDVFRRRTEGQAVLVLEEPVLSDSPDPSEGEEPIGMMLPMVEAAVVRAYLLITDGRHEVRVLLRHLRPCVELTRPELDSVLRIMAEEGRLQLETLPDDELSDEDRAAAAPGYRGELFHVVCLEP